MVIEVLVIAEPLFERDLTALELHVGVEGVLVEEANPIEHQLLVVERCFRTRKSNILLEARDILVLSRLLLEYIVRRNRIANRIAVANEGHRFSVVKVGNFWLINYYSKHFSQYRGDIPN